MIPLASTPAPVVPYPYLPSQVVEPEPFAWVFAILGGGILVWVGFMVLCVWAGYWFFRLAFRHAGMDVERWKRAGMPDRMPKRRPAPTPPRPWFQ